MAFTFPSKGIMPPRAVEIQRHVERVTRKTKLCNSSQDVCGIPGLWSSVAKPIVRFLAMLQHRLCCKTSCVAKPQVLRISCPLHYMVTDSLLRHKIFWPEEPDCSARVHDSEVVLQNRSSFSWQCRKTCFVVAVLQHRLCCKTSCVAKPHVLLISCPLHYMLIGSLLNSKIFWSKKPDCSARDYDI